MSKEVIDSKKLSDQENWNIQQKVLSLENSGKLSYNYIYYASNDTQAKISKRIESKNSESIQMAYNFAKKFVKTIDPSNDFLEEDIELVLSTVVKDVFVISSGPSAGCVYASILISLALQKPILQNLAMTGTISPTGKIGRIGDINKKVTAAVTAGLKTVIVPKENKEDFEALLPKIKKNIKVVYAEIFEDIYKVAF